MTPCKHCSEADVTDHCWHSADAAELADALVVHFGNPGPLAALGWIDDAEEMLSLMEKDDARPPFIVENSGLEEPKVRGYSVHTVIVNNWLFLIEADEDVVIHAVGKRKGQP